MPYSELSGKIGRIVFVSEERYPDLAVEVEGSKVRYICSVYGQLRDAAFLDEIDQARKQLIGKTAWILSKYQTPKTYDSASHKMGWFGIRRFAPVKIIDIVAGTEGNGPGTLLIFRTESGEEAFLSIYLSGSISSGSLDRMLSPSDPLKDRPWPREVKEAIQDGQVTLGMTPEQAAMALDGENISKTIAAGREEWSFSGGFVHFQAGIVTALDQSEVTAAYAPEQMATGSKITLGMNLRDVRRIVGLPLSRSEEMTPTGVKATWYTTQGNIAKVEFKDGVVAGFTTGRKDLNANSSSNALGSPTISVGVGGGNLPPLQKIQRSNPIGGPTLSVKNETAYTLLIVLSGRADKTISVAPGQSELTTLTAGTYDAVASVSASNILPVSGRYSFVDGSDYSITYTTTTTTAR